MHDRNQNRPVARRTSRRCGLTRLSPLILGVAVGAFFAVPVFASCNAPLPTAELRVLDEMAETNSLAAVAEANRRLSVTPPADAFTRAALFTIIADALDIIDNDPAARDAVALGRAELDRLAPGPSVEQLRLRLALIESDGLQTADKLTAGVAKLQALERDLPPLSLDHACLLLSRSRVESRLTHQDLAADAAVNAYQIARNLGAMNTAADAAYELATTYRRAGLFGDAIRMADEAIAYAGSVGHLPVLANALWEKARILGDTGDYAAALEVLAQSAQVTTRLGDVTGLAFDDMERCNELLGLKRIDEAERACLGAERQFRAINRGDQSVITQYYLVRIDLARGQFRAARARLDAALAADGREVPPRILAGLYNERSDAMSHLGRTADALRDLREATQIEARENQLQRSLGAAAVNARLQIERVDADNRELKRTVLLERELGARRAVTTRLSIGISLASLALSAALVTLLWVRARHLREMRRAAETLETRARVIHTIREGVLLVDDHGRIEYANPAVLQLVGRDLDELRAAGLEAIGLDQGALTGQAAAGADPLPEDRRELRLRTPAGNERVLVLTQTRLELGARRLNILVLHDVSEQRRLEREVLQTASAERDRLSHDLHDGLGQELTGIALLLKSVASRDTADQATLELIIGHVNQAIVNARTLAHSLAPVHLAGGALDVALVQLAANVSRIWPIKVTCTAALDGVRLKSTEADHLYRIAQESITNAMRHSGCNTVAIGLAVDRNNLTLSITDDGVGFANDGSSGGLGLRMISYRARLLHGAITVDRPPEGGTRITIRTSLRYLAKSPRAARIAGT